MAIEEELASQPELWASAPALASRHADAFPEKGERVAALGCGTSLFMAQAYARLREACGHGETDAFAASDVRWGRHYDRYVVISRSGTTSEVIHALERLRSTRSSLITARGESPARALATDAVVLDRATERSVVQTRFATTALALLRASIGDDLSVAVQDAGDALACPLPITPGQHAQLTFLGSGWAAPLAAEAALKCRESAAWWAESYLGMEYRHGPICAAGPSTAVWFLATPPRGLEAEVSATGATVVQTERDPMADLVLVHRLASALAARAGRDPDAPPGLSYSVILDRP